MSPNYLFRTKFPREKNPELINDIEGRKFMFTVFRIRIVSVFDGLLDPDPNNYKF